MYKLFHFQAIWRGGKRNGNRSVVQSSATSSCSAPICQLFERWTDGVLVYAVPNDKTLFSFFFFCNRHFFSSLSSGFSFFFWRIQVVWEKNESTNQLERQQYSATARGVNEEPKQATVCKTKLLEQTSLTRLEIVTSQLDPKGGRGVGEGSFAIVLKSLPSSLNSCARTGTGQ